MDENNNKKNETDLNKLREEYENIKIPENGLKGMEEAIERAKKDKVRKKRIVIFKRIGTCAAAALIIAILLPNVNANIAMAMEKIPVIGSIVRVVTFGRYNFEDENHEANVEIPKVELETGENENEAEQNANEESSKSVELINKDIEDYINPIVEEFKNSLSEESKKDLAVSYEVVMNTDEWFTLRLDVLEVQASGYEYNKFYHIDKATGKRVVLKDLFKENPEYIQTISEEIKRQMREQMAADEGKIFLIDSDMPEEEFKEIKEDQNFYFDGNGEIVIAFDEYEAAPGYMGKVEFTISKSIINY